MALDVLGDEFLPTASDDSRIGARTGQCVLPHPAPLSNNNRVKSTNSTVSHRPSPFDLV